MASHPWSASFSPQVSTGTVPISQKISQAGVDNSDNNSMKNPHIVLDFGIMGFVFLAVSWSLRLGIPKPQLCKLKNIKKSTLHWSKHCSYLHYCVSPGSTLQGGAYTSPIITIDLQIKEITFPGGNGSFQDWTLCITFIRKGRKQGRGERCCANGTMSFLANTWNCSSPADKVPFNSMILCNVWKPQLFQNMLANTSQC